VLFVCNRLAYDFCTRFVRNVRGEMRLVVVALKDVRNGDELTFDYGEVGQPHVLVLEHACVSYPAFVWRSRNASLQGYSRFNINCVCGSKCCIGVIGKKASHKRRRGNG